MKIIVFHFFSLIISSQSKIPVKFKMEPKNEIEQTPFNTFLILEMSIIADDDTDASTGVLTAGGSGDKKYW